MGSSLRHLEAGVWADPRFQALGKPLPNAQTLYLYLLSGPHTAQLPGLYRLGVAALAEELGWTVEDMRRIRDELTSAGLAFYDDDARVIYVPNALNVCPPTPECLPQWAPLLRLIPESPLRTRWCDDACALADQLDAFGDTFRSFCITVINGIPDLYISYKSIQNLSKKKNKSSPNDANGRNGANASDGAPAAEIIAYLNERSGKRYRHSSPASQRLISARWREGYRLDDFQAVIDGKCAEWRGTDFEKYLRPETLFSTKFEGYLNAKGCRRPDAQASGYRDLDDDAPSQEEIHDPA